MTLNWLLHHEESETAHDTTTRDRSGFETISRLVGCAQSEIHVFDPQSELCEHARRYAWFAPPHGHGPDTDICGRAAAFAARPISRRMAARSCASFAVGSATCQRSL